MSSTCFRCQHFNHLNQSHIGECRRFPPRMVGPDERRKPGYSRVPTPEWPVVEFSDWCGEFSQTSIQRTSIASKSKADDEVATILSADDHFPTA